MPVANSDFPVPHRLLTALRLFPALLVLPFMALSVQADDKEERQAIADFQEGWAKKELKAKFDAAKNLPTNSKKAVDHYFSVLDHEYWLVRASIFQQIGELSEDGAKEALLKKFEKEKKPHIKEALIWAWCNRRFNTADDWKIIQNIALDDKELPRVRATALRVMCMFSKQTIAKPNFEAYFTLLKRLCDEKMEKRVAKDKNLQLLKWQTVYGMENLTSQEWDDSVMSWEAWWLKNKDQPLEFRKRTAVSEDYEGLKVTGNTVARKRKKRNTDVELMVLPEFGYTPLYFAPYLDEFSQYFTLTSWLLPDAYAVTDADKKVESGDKKGYYYPMKKVADGFSLRQIKQGGRAGFMAVGLSSFVAMEYAKAYPKKAAFIICVGGWAGMEDMGKSIDQMKQSKESVTKWDGESRTFPPPPLTPEQSFEAAVGATRDMFSDRSHFEQFFVNAVGPDRSPSVSGASPLIDSTYAFTGKDIAVPTLFVFGADDPMYVKGTEQKLTKMFSNCKVVVMPGCSRVPWLEDPIGFFDEVQKFMDEKKVWDAITIKDEPVKK